MPVQIVRPARISASLSRRGSSSSREGWIHWETYVGRVEKFLKIVLYYINPYVAVRGQRSLSIRVLVCDFLQLLGSISAIVYSIDLFGTDADISEKAELVAITLVLTRCVIYFIALFILSLRMQVAVQQIITDRQSNRTSPVAWQLCLKYSKNEFIASMAFAIYYASTSAFIITSPFYMPNEIKLVYNFKVIFLPFDDVSSVNWLLSYILEASMGCCYASFFYSFVTLTMHIMDHSCWTLDHLLILVEELRSSSQDHDRNDQENENSLEKKMEKIVETSYSVLEWQKEAQDLLKFILMLDFSMQAIMTGSSLITLGNSLNASSSAYLLPMIMLPHLFVSCWMGERYIRRVEKLTEAMYDLPWYLMGAKQRNEIQMVLIMSQNLRGFNGIFYQVNMQTFTDVLKLTYSFFMMMRSTK